MRVRVWRGGDVGLLVSARVCRMCVYNRVTQWLYYPQ